MTDAVCLDHIQLTDRPLIVCDIDEVVLEFLTPFRDFLRSSGRDLLPRSFRLHGNVVLRGTQDLIADELLAELQEEFFRLQDQWQTPAALAIETLADLATEADVVFLTAMPPRHATIRRTLLDRHGLHYPLLATLEPKGPVVRRLHGDRPLPFAFIDDILRNLQSVQTHAPECLLINVMANAEFQAMAPDPGEGILRARDWPHVAELLREHCLR